MGGYYLGIFVPRCVRASRLWVIAALRGEWLKVGLGGQSKVIRGLSNVESREIR